MAGIFLLVRVAIAAHALVLVVVRQLLALLYRASRIDPDTAVLDDCLAVGIARMVDEARLVASCAAVDDRPLRQGEEVRVMPAHALVIVPLVSLGVRDPLAGVFNDALACTNAPCRERPATLYGGTADLERVVIARRDRHRGETAVKSAVSIQLPELRKLYR
jgi:hypothetical protein